MRSLNSNCTGGICILQDSTVTDSLEFLELFMASIEERLAKIEQELSDLRRERAQGTHRKNWVFHQSDRFKGDADLKEIFRLGKEIRDEERTKENH